MPDALDRHIKVLSGWAFPSDGFNALEGLPLIRIRDLGRGTTEVKFKGSYDPRYVINDGDVLIGMDGDFSVEKWEGGMALLNQRVCKVESASEDLDQGFLYWYLMPHVADIHRKTPQTTVRHLAASSLGRIVAPTISVAEQRTVNQVLDTLDTTIRQTEAIIEKLKQVKQGLLHDLLTRGIDANGELRPPQSHAPHLYKDSPLGWIPCQWRVAPLADLADVRSGTTPARSAASRYFAGGETAWVKTLDLNEGVVLSTDERVTDAALRECSCERLPVGTVLIAMYGGWEQIGRTAILGLPAATNQAISALVFGTSDLEPEYVLRAVQHGRPRWSSAAASTRKDPNITKADVSAFRIPLPESRDEQLRIVGTVRAALKRVEAEQAVLSQLQHLKSGLMEDLLTGRVRVTPLLPPEAAS